MVPVRSPLSLVVVRLVVGVDGGGCGFVGGLLVVGIPGSSLEGNGEDKLLNISLLHLCVTIGLSVSEAWPAEM